MLENVPEKVKVFEVGPRDGLQNEAVQVSTSDKLRLINALANSGLKHIEATSFVSPKWIPQLADGAQVISSLDLPKDIHISALVPNLKGLETASTAGLKNIAIFMSATESHNKKNINKTTQEALAVLKDVAEQARAQGMSVRAYLSVVFVCPYEGKTNPSVVANLIEKLMEIGVDELSLGDTIGAATPNMVQDLLKIVIPQIGADSLALHFHDTRGMALANVLAGLDMGVSTYDASIGGLGGCPYAPGASGNLATEDLVFLLDGLGIKTGINLEKLIDCGQLAQDILGKELPGRNLKAELAKRKIKMREANSCQTC